jgi:methylglutaconyl-CoA hydratase
MSEPVLLVESLDESTAVLTLNRPERRNALTVELLQVLCAQLESLAREPRRRVAILRGAGQSFCSGLDLKDAADSHPLRAGSVSDPSTQEAPHWVARTFQTLLETPLITIAAAHGAAYAGGGGLLACCDLAVASDDLQVGFPEVRRGLMPAMVAAILHNRLRAGDLRELLLLAEPISAQRAREIGLVHRIVPADRVLGEACMLAAQITAGAPSAVRCTKAWLRDLASTPPHQAQAEALQRPDDARESAEAAEGLAAFRERREPQWPAP